METIKRWYNWCRIKILEIFTNRVQRIEITDTEGKKHDVVIEKQIEKVCDHKNIQQIDHIFWKCTGCDEVYFVITQKLQASRADVEKHVLDMGNHLTEHA